MKLIKMSGEKLGLFVPLREGACVVDVAASLSVFAPHDPVAIGLLNGTLKDGCNWALIVKHWEHLRSPLRKLARVAMVVRDHPLLVAVPFAENLRADDEVNSIVALEITDIEPREPLDPTGRKVMEQQFMNRAETKGGDTAASKGSAQVIPLWPFSKSGSSSR
jgi:hypothetical protein